MKEKIMPPLPKKIPFDELAKIVATTHPKDIKNKTGVAKKNKKIVLQISYIIPISKLV